MFIDKKDIKKNIYIYGFGTAGKWFSEQKGVKTINFIDTDVKKRGMQYNGIQVIDINQAKSKINSDDLIVISVVDIQDVIKIINEDFNNQWLSLSHFIDPKLLQENISNKKNNEFVNYSLEAMFEMHDAFLSNNNSLCIRSVDLMITEKCTLKCKDCANLMQFYESPINIDLSEVQLILDKLLKKLDLLYEVRLIGGEPFANKSIYNIIKYIIDKDKIKRCVVYTNGTVNIKDDFIPLLQNPKVVFSITDYGFLSRNIDKLEDSLKKNSIIYRRHEPEYWTDSGKILSEPHSISYAKDLFDKCCGKNLITVSDEKIYRCPFAANSDRLKSIPHDEKNFIEIESTPKKIKNYLENIDYIPACQYCNGRSFDSPLITPAIQTKKPINFRKYD